MGVDATIKLREEVQPEIRNKIKIQSIQSINDSYNAFC